MTNHNNPDPAESARRILQAARTIHEAAAGQRPNDPHAPIERRRRSLLAALWRYWQEHGHSPRDEER